MSNAIALKRILSDIKDLHNNNLENEKIYISFDEANLFDNFRVLMIGPSDTPYHHGFYFFKIKFPDNYPFSPPIVTFMTGDGKTRFNPNLYVNGKVCLSLLNTWSGPTWTSCQTIRAVLMTIYSHCFNDNPLTNEPGYENRPKDYIYCKNYNRILHHQNFVTAIIFMVIQPPEGFEVFLPTMIDYLRNHSNSILQNIESCKNIKTTLSDVYSSNHLFSIQYDTVLEHMMKLFNRFNIEYNLQSNNNIEKTIIKEVISQQNDIPINNQVNTTQSSINELPKASQYDDGYTTTINNIKYVVYSYTMSRNGKSILVKKWKNAK
jgi:ubiquitin-protein ligase